MASFPIPATTTTLSSSSPSPSSSYSLLSRQHHRSFLSYPWIWKGIDHAKTASAGGLCLSTRTRAVTMDFSGSFFEEGRDDDGGQGGPSAASAVATVEEGKEEPQCPPGLRQYETMMVLRPDMSEDERLGLTERYEELLVAGGGMYVEVFNRGVIPLAYSIKKKNKAGESNTYLDGIYLLFTYFNKPESLFSLESRLKSDDDVIRSSSFKIRKRKY